MKKLPVLARLCVFQVLTNSIGRLRKSDIENIIRFFHKDIIGKICSANNGYVLLNDRKHVIVKKKEPKEIRQLELKIGEKCNFEGMKCYIKIPNIPNNAMRRSKEKSTQYSKERC